MGDDKILHISTSIYSVMFQLTSLTRS